MSLMSCMYQYWQPKSFLSIFANKWCSTLSFFLTCCSSTLVVFVGFWWVMNCNSDIKQMCVHVSPSKIVSAIFSPVVLENVLHALSSSCQDGQPCQHGPKSILLTNVVSTWNRICNYTYISDNKKNISIKLTFYQLIISLKIEASFDIPIKIQYLCQSFPLHTETVFLHPLGSQKTSTQWEFHITLFLLPLLLCREQNERVFQDSLWNNKSETLKYKTWPFL